MTTLVRRYAHVPLGIVSLLSILAVIAWLVVRRVDGVSDRDPGHVAADVVSRVATVVEEVTHAFVPGAPPEAPASVGSVPVAPVPAFASGAAPRERYALESGPFTSTEIAGRREDELGRLGYATVRFRRQALARAHVVTVTGVGTRGEAEQVARELGRGTVVETGGGAEVIVHRLPELRQAAALAEALRGRGFEVRIDEEVTPTVLYHVRYGQFPSHAAAQARGQELARQGLENRVVKVR
jgi:hypothetical protein